MNWGSRHGLSKLTEADVLIVRALAKDGMNNTQIAKRYGVDRKTISFIVHRKNWAWL